MLADPDVAGLGRSLAMVLRGAMEHPAHAAQAWFRYSLRLAELPPVALSSWMGAAATPPVPLNQKDRRCADPTWSDNPAFYSLRMYHQASAEFVDQLVTAARLDRIQETKARLMTGLMMDALAPANFLLTNPAALRRAVETGGASLVKSTRNFSEDLLNNKGRAQLEVEGETIDIGPGDVISVDRGREHRFFNITEDLAVLVTFAPQDRLGVIGRTRSSRDVEGNDKARERPAEPVA